MPRSSRPLPRFWPLAAGLPPPEGAFIALLPGEEAPLLPVQLPPALKGAAREAVARRQIESRLGPAASGLELRPARLGEERFTSLLVIGQEALAGWRSGAGRALALLPDYLALPAAGGLWWLRCEAGRVIARLGPAEGFAAETGLAALLLAEARRRAAPAGVVIEGAPEPAVAAALEGLPRSTGEGAALLGHGERGLDLLRARSGAASVIEARLRAAVLPLALAGLGTLGWAAAVALETARIEARAEALADGITAIVRREIFPSGPLIDIPAQIAREIAARERAAQPSPEGLALLQRGARLLVAAGRVPEALGLAGAEAPRLTLGFADEAGLATLIGDFAAAGMGLEAESTEPHAGGLRAVLRLEARP